MKKQRIISSIEDIKAPVTYLIEHNISQLLLHGELGAGKTTFVQERARQLTGSGEHVKSPTYTYMNVYNESLLHIDMRRIEKEALLHELGILDALDTYKYSAIERPKRTDNRKNTGAALITIEKKDGKRVLTLQEQILS